MQRCTRGEGEVKADVPRAYCRRIQISSEAKWDTADGAMDAAENWIPEPIDKLPFDEPLSDILDINTWEQIPPM